MRTEEEQWPSNIIRMNDKTGLYNIQFYCRECGDKANKDNKFKHSHNEKCSRYEPE